jgi:hypothetical protein
MIIIVITIITGTGKTYSLFGSSGSNHSHDSSVNKNKRNSTLKKGKSFIDGDDFRTINENSGLIPRILNDVIEGINDKEKSDELDDVRITFSFLEIYNEKIRDLLLSPTEESYEGGWDTSSAETSSILFQSSNPNTFNPSLKVREHPILGPYVEGLSKPVVHTIEDVIQLLSLGLSKRSSAATILNNQVCVLICIYMYIYI